MAHSKIQYSQIKRESASQTAKRRFKDDQKVGTRPVHPERSLKLAAEGEQDDPFVPISPCTSD